MLTVYDANIQIATRLTENQSGFSLLNQVPENVDAEMAAQLLARDLNSGQWRMCQSHEHVSLRIIEYYLEMTLGQREVIPVIAHTLISPTLEAKKIRWQWKTFLHCLATLDSSSQWSSKARKLKILSLAQHPEILVAIQAAVSLGKPVKIDLLAVLVANASEDSLDSLMPHFHDSVTSLDSRLDSLAQLRIHANSSPQLDVFFAQVSDKLSQRNDNSPALEVLKILEIKEKFIWFRFTFWSKELLRNGMPKVRGGGHIDSRQADWFQLSVVEDFQDAPSQWTRIRMGQLQHDDAQFGSCEIHLLPSWISQVAQKRSVTFGIGLVTSNLRQKHSDALQSWLSSGS